MVIIEFITTMGHCCWVLTFIYYSSWLVDLHRTVHVQINHCNIFVIFFIMQMLFFIMQRIGSIRPTRCFTRIVNSESVFSLSLSSTSCWSNGKWREREICLMWNNDGTATENNKRVWFCLMWNNSLVSFMLGQRNLTRERDCFCLMWNSFTLASAVGRSGRWSPEWWQF